MKHMIINEVSEKWGLLGSRFQGSFQEERVKSIKYIRNIKM